MKLISKPNIPTHKVCLCAVSYKENDLIKSLEKLGIDVIKVFESNLLGKNINTHADCIIHHLGIDKNGENIIVTSEDCLVDLCNSYGFKTIKTIAPNDVTPLKYPYDIFLNCARIGNRLFCLEKYCDKLVLDFCSQNNITIVPVKQGYSKCNIAIISENAAITSDMMLYKTMINCGVECLLISPGNIKLDGYEYGFIGGCCFLLDENTLAFNGLIKNHPDYLKITSFCNKNDVEIISLTQNTLTDCGSIIPLACC